MRLSTLWRKSYQDLRLRSSFTSTLGSSQDSMRRTLLEIGTSTQLMLCLKKTPQNFQLLDSFIILCNSTDYMPSPFLMIIYMCFTRVFVSVCVSQSFIRYF